ICNAAAAPRRRDCIKLKREVLDVTDGALRGLEIYHLLAPQANNGQYKRECSCNLEDVQRRQRISECAFFLVPLALVRCHNQSITICILTNIGQEAGSGRLLYTAHEFFKKLRF